MASDIRLARYELRSNTAQAGYLLDNLLFFNEYHGALLKISHSLYSKVHHCTIQHFIANGIECDLMLNLLHA